MVELSVLWYSFSVRFITLVLEYLLFKKESIIVGSLFLLFLSALFASFYLNSSAPVSSTSRLVPSKKGIAVVDLYGPISFSSPSQSLMPHGATDVIAQIKSFEKDPQVKALLLRINSPGGTVGASQEIYQAILDFKARKKVPVVASIGDVGASGAYYAAMACDTIFANPGSLVGSIGVILGNVNITDFADKQGLGFNVYKSGAFKDSLSIWKKPSAEESVLLQNLVDTVYHQFVAALIQNRHLTPEHAAKIAQGQVFSGEQAKQENLVDELGGLSEALAYTAQRANINGDPLILNRAKPNVMDFIGLFEGGMKNSLAPYFFPNLGTGMELK